VHRSASWYSQIQSIVSRLAGERLAVWVILLWVCLRSLYEQHTGGRADGRGRLDGERRKSGGRAEAVGGGGSINGKSAESEH